MAAKLAFAAATLALFGITVLVLLRVMPPPHRPTDYMVIGTMATFICLLVVFLVAIVTSGRWKGAFFKRRPPNGETR